MADIFISYSSTDKTIVKRIAGLLEKKGWSVWWDRQIPIGRKYDTVIETEIQNAGCVLVVWTERSIKSEWVKNEASEAAAKEKMVPMVLETVTLPLAFRRIESAMLIDWKGEEDHPELEILYSSISNIIGKRTGTSAPVEPPPPPPRSYKNIVLASAALVAALVCLYLYRQQEQSISSSMFYLLLLVFSLSISVFTIGLLNSFSWLKNQAPSFLQKLLAPAVGLMVFIAGIIFISPAPAEKNLTIRLFDRNRNPIKLGEVKIYLPEYVRTQSIDQVGQALFTGIPSNSFRNKMKIEINSPGYAGRVLDTVLHNCKILEFTLALTPVVFISGLVKTAADIPIRGAEVTVDGTRYYALSISDGSYNLRLEEYTLGDEINITTTHKDFEDKTFLLRIQSPNMQEKNIYLNPITH